MRFDLITVNANIVESYLKIKECLSDLKTKY